MAHVLSISMKIVRFASLGLALLLGGLVLLPVACGDTSIHPLALDKDSDGAAPRPAVTPPTPDAQAEDATVLDANVADTSTMDPDTAVPDAADANAQDAQ